MIYFPFHKKNVSFFVAGKLPAIHFVKLLLNLFTLVSLLHPFNEQVMTFAIFNYRILETVELSK